MTDDEQPPLFAGEPANCSLCGEAGHTHDDHWLFQHDAVKALQKRVDEMRATLVDFEADARRAFIRDAAQVLYIYGRRTGSGHNSMAHAEAWAHAQALWDAKPEDC